MGKSISTTSNTTTPANNQVTFDIGKVVLCASFNPYPFLLTRYGKEGSQ